jgi:CRISPR/Cas system CSM-associated protein Csm3 (group 7 of RAMP superfamily)
MMTQNQHWLKSREISERIIIEGELELVTPAHFGTGDADSLTDMALLRDESEGRALLPGASIAGALRSYWRERTKGYEREKQHSVLFGARRAETNEDQAYQSALIVEDALGELPQIEVREGVAIDATTRTAEDKKLFDMEVLRAGTRFGLRFEVLLPKNKDTAKQLCRDLVLALEGLENGEINLGARKRRGLGKCQVREWRVQRYDLVTREGLLAWLAEGRAWNDRTVVAPKAGKQIATLLDVTTSHEVDRRDRFEIAVTLRLTGSLLIRSGSGEAAKGPDVVHLRGTAIRADRPPAPDEPIVSGTSLAGVLRARAQRIAQTLAPGTRQAETLIHVMFGVGPADHATGKSQASRVSAQETVVEGARTLVQNRIRVDRFTGGAMDSYLFNEAPVFGGDNSQVTFQLSLRNPQDHEIGLLLLLLKDLWTGDLPVGGESGIGRGRLAGKSATLSRLKTVEDGKRSQTRSWKLEQLAAGLNITDPDRTGSTPEDLEGFVAALNAYLAGGQA